MFESRKPPTAIARQLRQESGFGCAVCGNPIIEYHHIIEWSERKHFDSDHMVALCPSHHTEYGKLSRTKSYAAKLNPINIRNGKIKGYLGGSLLHKGIRIGSVEVTNCQTVISYSGIPMVSLKLVDDEALLNFYFPRQDFWPEIEIKENEATAWTGGFWDIEFKTNWIKLKRMNSKFLEIDFRKEFVEVFGQFELHGKKFEFKRSETKLGSGTIQRLKVSGCTTAIAIGSDRRILRPNYAMAIPKAHFAG